VRFYNGKKDHGICWSRHVIIFPELLIWKVYAHTPFGGPYYEKANLCCGLRGSEYPFIEVVKLDPTSYEIHQEVLFNDLAAGYDVVAI